MPLETATHINQLVAANPTATDPKSQGDDHLRLIKSALLTDLANIGGPVVSTHSQLNYASALRTNWATKGNIVSVAGLLGWKNYGDGRVVFDASAGTNPDGTACSKIDAAVPWTANYPTLMGYDGSTTYGARVDSARLGDRIKTVGLRLNYNASRALNVTYTNTTDSAIGVFVTVNLSPVVGQSTTLFIGGVPSDTICNPSNGIFYYTLKGIVGAGEAYGVTAEGSGSMTLWIEAR